MATLPCWRRAAHVVCVCVCVPSTMAEDWRLVIPGTGTSRTVAG